MQSTQSKHFSKPLPAMLLFWGFLALVFAFFFFINTKMPLVGEDYTNQEWNYHNAPATLTEKVSVVFQREVSLNLYWAARFGEHLAPMTAVFPKFVFNFINSLVFVWLLIVLFGMAYGRFPSPNSTDDLLFLFVLFALILGLFPLLGQVFFWKSGATNYHWGITLILSFALPFRFNLKRRVPLIHWGGLVGFCFLGFLAGSSMENTSPAVFALLAAYFGYALFRKAIDWKWIFPLTSYGLGLVYLLFSPGTAAKTAVYAAGRYDGDLTGLPLYFNRFLRVGSDFVHTSFRLGMVILICLAVLAVLLWWKKRSLRSLYVQNQADWHAIAGMFLAALIAILILAAIPYQSDQRRSMFLFWFMEILLIGTMVAWIRKELPKAASIGVVVLVGILLVYKMAQITNVYVQFAQQSDARMEAINAALAAGEKEVTLPAVTIPDSRILETREILSDLGDRYAVYYGFDKVVIDK